jgi:alpha-tubulin suppressor-like RCC1 family protein/sugar lactone lactonase YvrE
VAVDGLGEPVDGLAAGELHTCALTRSGLVKCWGAGGTGQLGDGTGMVRSNPTPVLALDNVVSLDSGNWYACAVTAAGAVWCWGDNANGQVGDGTTTRRLAPVNVQGLAAGAVSVATGHDHACALLDDGTVRCWGDNAHGQVGDGTQTPRLVPVQVAGLTDAVAIAAGFMHTCALTAGGAVRCWGANDHGQLGDGTTTMRLTPVAASGLSSGAVTLAAGDGDSHTCAVMGDGTLRCWGANTDGQLGDGTIVSRSTPVPVSGLSGGLRVTAGKTHTCALTSAGAVTCWGDNSAGQLGSGTLVSRTVPVPMAPVAPPVTWPTPAPIPFGTVLSAVQLNASSGVAGAFTYDPPNGTLLDVGSHALRTTFTPDDTISYTPVSSTVTLVVTRAVPAIDWDEPAPIVYGTRLSDAQLNAAVSPPLVGTVTVGTATTETSGPVAVAADAAGAVYVAEYRGAGGRLLKITPAGTVQTILGSGGFYGIAVAPDGTIYASQILNHRILRVTPAGVVTVLAGGTRGSADGVGAAAQFYYPCGLALDAAGTLYVADRDNHRIRRIDPATSEVTTIAGSSLGYVDGTGAAARFNTPWGVAIDSAGTIYVADTGNYRIRSISPAGEVTTLAGSVKGFADGIGTAARFATPWGVAVDAAGRVYVADAGNGNGDFFSIGAGNNHVRLVTPAGVVSTLAGSTTAGYVDGSSAVARFNGPRGVAVGPSGTVYIADEQNNRVRTLSFSGLVYTPPAGTLLDAGPHLLSVAFTPADSVRYAPATDTTPLTVERAVPSVSWATPAPIVYGTPLSAVQLNATASIVGTFGYAPAAGTVLGGGTHTLRATFIPADTNFAPVTASATLVVSPAPTLVSWATPSPVAYGTPLSPAQLNATASVPGTFAYLPPAGTVLGAGAHTLTATFTPANPMDYSAATASVTLVVGRVTPTVTWPTPAPIAHGTPLSGLQLDATASVAAAASPTTVATVADAVGPVAVAVDESGTAYVAEYDGGRVLQVDPSGAVQVLASPGALYGIARDRAGTLYVSQVTGHRILKISPTGVVTTLAGGGTPGYADGVGTAARFYYPCGLGLDAAGMLYVADRDNHRIRRVNPATGAVTTIAGSTQGYGDGTGTTARFNTPWGVAVDAAGTIYVADAGNYRIRRISPTGQVTTLAGSTQGFADGIGAAAKFATPWSVAVDAAGWVYVADAGSGNGDFFSIGAGNNHVRLVSPAGGVATLAGSVTPGYIDGTAVEARFNGPRGVAVASDGAVFVADQQNNKLRRMSLAGLLYAPPAGTVPEVGSLTLSVHFTPADAVNYTPAAATVSLLVRLVPRLDELRGRLRVGATNTLTGTGFTTGSVINLWVSTASGVTSHGPFVPAEATSSSLAWDIPAEVALGNGFASLQVVNADDGYTRSNVVGALLEGEPARNIPTILAIDGEPLATVTPGVNVAHVDTVIAPGATVTLAGLGFSNPLVNLFTADGNIGPLVPLPGGSASVIQVRLPASAPVGPANFQVVNAPFTGAVTSNAVSAVIGWTPEITRVEVAGSTITVMGRGFSRLSVINLYNRQGAGVVNLGGFGASGPKVPLTFVDDTRFSFERPAGAVAGAAFLEVLNPPFIAFATSGNDPDGAFVLP